MSVSDRVGARSRVPIRVAVVSALATAFAVALVSGCGARDGEPARLEAPGGAGAASAAEATWLPKERPAPEIALRDRGAGVLPLSALRGRTVLLTFLDSRCTHICQTLGPSLGRVQDLVRMSEPPVIVAVSVNPADTPASVSDMAAAWNWGDGRWHWYLGTAGELQPTWEAYGIDVQTSSQGMLHSGAVYVIDGAGDLRAGFATPIEDARVAAVVDGLHDGAVPATGG